MTDAIAPTYHVENIDQYNHLIEEDSATFANKKIREEGYKLLGLFPNHSDMKDNYPVIYVLGKVYDHI